MKNLFCFVEIPVTDMKRACTFWSALLDIQLEPVTYADAEMAFFPSDGSNVSGALINDPRYVPSEEGVLVYLDGGDNADALLSKVTEAGGKVLMGRTKVAENHYWAMFRDSEGNRLALFSRG